MSTRCFFWSPKMPELSLSPSGTRFPDPTQGNLWCSLRPFIAGFNGATSRRDGKKGTVRRGWDGRKWRERRKGREGEMRRGLGRLQFSFAVNAVGIILFYS